MNNVAYVFIASLQAIPMIASHNIESCLCHTSNCALCTYLKKFLHSGRLSELMGMVRSRMHAWNLQTSRRKAVVACKETGTNSYSIFLKFNQILLKKWEELIVKIITRRGSCTVVLRKSAMITEYWTPYSNHMGYLFSIYMF